MVTQLKTSLTTLALKIVLIVIRLVIFSCATLAIYFLLKAQEKSDYFLSFCFGLGTIIGVYTHFFEPRQIEIDSREIPLNFCQNNKTLKLAIISDLHLGPYNSAKFLEKIVNKINSLNPDLILIAGDLYFYPNLKNIQSIGSPLKKLQVPCYAVSGNHDYDNNHQYLPHLKAVLKNTNCHLIDNKKVELKINTTPLTIIGLSDLEESQPNPELITKQSLPKNSIVLIHNPDQIHTFASTKVPLTIAGHTHGGQIRIPLFYKKAIPTNHPFDWGLSEEKNTLLYITSGVGCSGLPLRFLRPAQIAILTIS